MSTDVHQFLQVLLIILVTARVFAELAVRVGSLSVMGELVAGVVLGPSLLGWIEPFDAIRMLAEIGIILLLFEVGLETDLTRLRRSGGKSLIVALCGLVFAELGRGAGVFSNEIYAGMIIVIALTTLLPPILLKWLHGRYPHRMRQQKAGQG